MKNDINVKKSSIERVMEHIEVYANITNDRIMKGMLKTNEDFCSDEYTKIFNNVYHVLSLLELPPPYQYLQIDTYNMTTKEMTLARLKNIK